MKSAGFITLIFLALVIVIALATSPKDKDYGIGPVKSLSLGKIDNNMVNKGRDLFNGKCIACHTLDQKRIGPPLRNIVNEQTPEYIMNMLLNTQEMTEKNAHVKQLLSVYKVPMINNQLSQQQAREILEYLREAGSVKGFN